MIIIESEGIKVEGIGTLNITPTKKSYSEVETIYGNTTESYTTLVRDLDIEIKKMDATNYENLFRIFSKYNDSITITDTTTGEVYGKMFIKGETLDFNKVKDFGRLDWVYSGALSICRR